MSKSANVTLSLAAIALLTTTSFVHAADKAETMTCSEFLAVGEEYQPHLVHWMDGHKRGKAGKENYSVEMIKRPVTSIIDACKAAPEKHVAKVMDETEGWAHEN